MIIGIASDHRGVDAKKKVMEHLSNYEVINYGTDSYDSVDYPDYAFKIGNDVKDGKINKYS